jgi:hypothetical protein
VEQKKTYKLDIFQTLGQIDNKNHNFYDELTIDQQKGFYPVIAMRWMSGTNVPLQVILLNELVNPYVYSLFNHKNLLFKLMTICTTKKQRYKWIKTNSDSHSCRHCIEVIKLHYGYNSQQAKEVFPLLSSTTIIDLASLHGLQKDEIQRITTELKNR